MTFSKVATVLGLLICTAPVAAIEQGSLQTCRSIQAKIDYYSDLKRQGGSSAEMARWHKKRNHYKGLYADNNCKVYRGKLRQR